MHRYFQKGRKHNRNNWGQGGGYRGAEWGAGVCVRVLRVFSNVPTVVTSTDEQMTVCEYQHTHRHTHT